MEKLKTEILEILEQFSREELGNRLSQFAMLALKGAIQMKFEKAISEAKDASKTP